MGLRTGIIAALAALSGGFGGNVFEIKNSYRGYSGEKIAAVKTKRGNRSKYMPHQGAKEKARRVRQMEKTGWVGFDL